MEGSNMLNGIKMLIARLARDEAGLTAVEYAVLGALVVAAITAATTTFSTDLAAKFNAIL
jgi:pilus assembly protein Flp/PilA